MPTWHEVTDTRARNGRTSRSRDTSQIFGNLLQLLQGITLHHADGLHEERTAAVDAGHGLSRLKGIAELILHHSHDTLGVLSAPGGVADDMLIAQLSYHR